VANVATIRKTQIARPLKVLIPLIQGELQQGDIAGRTHYATAGKMLIEAQGQVTRGQWTGWLSKNFSLSRSTAYAYMQWARHLEERMSSPATQTEIFSSIRQMRGDTDRRREDHQSKQQQQFRRVLSEVARDDFVQERQDRKDELALHQDLALELIEIGYRALATRLHPDRGGTKDAMSRLNRVRDELKHIAQTRRFV
jgi:hypothetical protein